MDSFHMVRECKPKTLFGREGFSSTRKTPASTHCPFRMRYLLARSEGVIGEAPPFRITEENVSIKAPAIPCQDHDEADTRRGGDFHISVDDEMLTYAGEAQRLKRHAEVTYTPNKYEH